MEQQIKDFLEQLRPALIADGGDMEFVSFDEPTGVLSIEFLGACSHCTIADSTLGYFVKERVIERFPQVTDVLSV